MEREVVLTAAAIILGGGINDDGSLPPHVRSRLELCSKMHEGYSFIIFSSRYSLNKPPVLDSEGFIVTEAAAMAKEYCSKYHYHGQVFLELFSTDTIGSALNCRSLIENINIYIRTIDIITSDWHSKRSKLIFDWAFSLQGYTQPTPIPNIRGAIDGDIISDKRNLRESHSLQKFKDNWSSIKNRSDAWLKLLSHHDNYNIENRSNFRAHTNDFY
ncbi:YdcF family protein [Amylibacter sp.]|nr:YdcF family protein [Amylibacter sp.]